MAILIGNLCTVVVYSAVLSILSIFEFDKRLRLEYLCNAIYIQRGKYMKKVSVCDKNECMGKLRINCSDGVKFAPLNNSVHKLRADEKIKAELSQSEDCQNVARHLECGRACSPACTLDHGVRLGESSVRQSW